MADELDRRELLESALEQAEEGTLEAPEEKEIEVNDDPIEAESSEESSEESPDRDEKGRFKAKEASAEVDSETDTVEEPDSVGQVPAVAEEVKRPTTWKKEYVEIWNKMEKGEQLNKEVEADIPSVNTQELQRSISYLENQLNNILGAVAYRQETARIQAELRMLEAKRLEELDDEESILILLH